MSLFKRAERTQLPLKIAMQGTSGSGKTYSALQMAWGLVGNVEGAVALIDTENRSSESYCDLGFYDVAHIAAPFTVEKYLAALRDAEANGYKCVIIDSLSHAWAGEGGLLQQKEALDVRGSNHFANWTSITKQHEKLKNAMLQSPLQVIACMRSKTEYEQDPQTKKVQKLGLAPIQRAEMEYEFFVVVEIASDHTAAVTKDRTRCFVAETGINMVTPEWGQKLEAWRKSGAPLTPENTPPPVEAPTPAPVARPATQPATKNGNGRSASPQGAAHSTASAPTSTEATQDPAPKAPGPRSVAWKALIETPLFPVEEALRKATLGRLINITPPDGALNDWLRTLPVDHLNTAKANFEKRSAKWEAFKSEVEDYYENDFSPEILAQLLQQAELSPDINPYTLKPAEYNLVYSAWLARKQQEALDDMQDLNRDIDDAPPPLDGLDDDDDPLASPSAISSAQTRAAIVG